MVESIYSNKLFSKKAFNTGMAFFISILAFIDVCLKGILLRYVITLKKW
jgi:hypothetical protein